MLTIRSKWKRLFLFFSFGFVWIGCFFRCCCFFYSSEPGEIWETVANRINNIIKFSMSGSSSTEAPTTSTTTSCLISHEYDEQSIWSQTSESMVCKAFGCLCRTTYGTQQHKKVKVAEVWDRVCIAYRFGCDVWTSTTWFFFSLFKFLLLLCVLCWTCCAEEIFGIRSTTTIRKENWKKKKIKTRKPQTHCLMMYQIGNWHLP